MKIEWLVADVTAVESLDRAERAILERFLTGCVFGQLRSFCVREPLCDVGTPS